MARQSTVKTIGTNQTATTTMSSLLVAATSLTFESLEQLNKTSSALGGHEPDGAGGGWPFGSDPCKQTHKYQNNASTSAAAANNNNSTQFNFNLEADQDELYVKMSTFWYCFLAFVTAIGLFVSLISNMIIIYLFTGTPSFRRNPSNIIAVNLSLSDLLYCIQWPSVIYCSLSQSTWMLEIDFVCKTFGFITVTTASASVLTVLAMSVERAIVIKYSIYAKSRYTIRIAWSIVVLIWFVSISSALPPLFDKFNRFTLDPSKTSCTLDYLSGKTHFKLYMLLIYIIYWILPATIITICYIFIIITFKRSSKQIAAVGAAAPPPPSWASWSSNSATAAGVGSDQVEINPSNGGRFWSGVRFGPGLRVHSRDSIRWPSMWPAPLRRSSTTRLAKGQADGRKSAAKMTATKSSDNLFGFHAAGRNRLVQQTIIAGQLGPSAAQVATTGPEIVCRQLDSVECNVSTSNLEPNRARRGMEPERFDDASKCKTTRANEPANSSGQVTLDHCRPGRWQQRQRQQQTRQPETSDENSPTTLGAASSVLGSGPKINTICGSNEPFEPASSLKWHSSGRRRCRRHSCGDSSNILASDLPDSGSLNGRQVISMNSPRPLWARHGLDELDIAKLHAVRRCGQLDGGGDEIVAESELTTADSRQAPRSSRAKLVIISRVMAQLNRASSFGGQQLTSATTTTINLTTDGDRAQKELNLTTNATAHDNQQPTEATQTTCHFGNSSLHSAARASMQIRLAKTSFYLIVLWLISWTPIASLTLINLIVECHLRANALVVFLANTMTKLGPTFDVFIYGISHPKIKRKFIQIIKRLLMLNNQTDDDLEDRSRFSVASNKLSFNSTFHRTQNRSISRSLTLGEDKLQANTGRFHRLRSGVGQVRTAKLF